jgi:hypothetical protein
MTQRPRRLAIIVTAASVATLLIGVCGAVTIPHLFSSMKLSWAKRRVNNVTVIACAIERYRAREGRLPASQTDLKGYLVPIPREHVMTTSPSGYTVSDAGGGEVWEITNGAWRRWPAYVPKEWLVESEEQIAACRNK